MITLITGPTALGVGFLTSQSSGCRSEIRDGASSVIVVTSESSADVGETVAPSTADISRDCTKGQAVKGGTHKN